MYDGFGLATDVPFMADSTLRRRRTEVRRPLTFGSLCSGIGGLDLGLERAGWACRWQAEIDPYASRVLAKHWPNQPNLGDVKTIEWEKVERVELVCGGYPCQPFSLAGRRRGERDPRRLWPDIARCLRSLRPRFVLLENVPGHLSLGFGRVLGDLAELGYDAEWDCVSAASVGAPHIRDRLFILAYPRGFEPERRRVAGNLAASRRAVEGEAQERQRGGYAAGDRPAALSNPDAEGVGRGERRPGRTASLPQGRDAEKQTLSDPAGGRSRQRRREQFAAFGQRARGLYWPIGEPGIRRMADGVPHRLDRLRGIGNAVVPAVAEWFGLILRDWAAGEQVSD